MALSVSASVRGQAREAGTEKSGLSGISLSRAKGSLAGCGAARKRLNEKRRPLRAAFSLVLGRLLSAGFDCQYCAMTESVEFERGRVIDADAIGAQARRVAGLGQRDKLGEALAVRGIGRLRKVGRRRHVASGGGEIERRVRPAHARHGL